MNPPENFKIVGDRGEFRPKGQVSLDDAIALVSATLAFAREQKIPKVLVDTSELIGFPPPSTTARYFFIHEWARAAGGAVRVAIVARPEMIDPKKFGVMVAHNVGLRTDVFVSEAEALAWLERLD